MPAAPLILFLALATGIILVPKHESRVILLPDPDGKVGVVEIQTEAGRVLLEEAGQMVRVSDAKRPPEKPVQLSRNQIEREFAEVLAAEPPQPQKFILYFHEGTSELVVESESLLAQIIAEIRQRKSVAIGIYGHSDRVGSKEDNMKLSLDRALAVRSLLEASGIKPETIDIDSHGEGNPLVPTADNVAEPRNRRVEVIVR